MQNILTAILSILLIFVLSSCSSKNDKTSILEDENLEIQMIDAYKEAYEEFEKGDVIYAAKKFNEAELLYPQSEWAPRSVLLAAYSYYSQNYYDEALSELNRFFKKYPKHNNIDYAHIILERRNDGRVTHCSLDLKIFFVLLTAQSKSLAEHVLL